MILETWYNSWKKETFSWCWIRGSCAGHAPACQVRILTNHEFDGASAQGQASSFCVETDLAYVSNLPNSFETSLVKTFQQDLRQLSSLWGASSDRTCVVRQLLQQDDVRKRGLATQDVSDNAWGGRQSIICSEGCKLTLWGSADVPVGCVEIRNAIVVSLRKMAN